MHKHSHFSFTYDLFNHKSELKETVCKFYSFTYVYNLEYQLLNHSDDTLTSNKAKMSVLGVCKFGERDKICEKG